MHTAKLIASPRKARARVIQAAIIACVLEALAGSVWANPNLPTDPGFRSVGSSQTSGSAVPDARSVTVIAKRGDTLLALLHEQGLDGRYCARLLPVIGKQDTRPLHAGDRIELSLVTSGSFNLLRSIEIESRNAKPRKVDIPADLWQATTDRREVSGIVGSNLGASLRRAGLPAALMDAVLSATKLDRDLASTLKSTSAFAIAFDEVRLGGRTVGNPHLLDISLTTGELEHRLYFFRDPEVGEALVDANGKGIAWLHLQRPVGRAKLTSPFGWRIHPVFGDRRFHYGIDLATSEGAPVTAAGDGVVIDAGWHGDYGQYVRLRHSLGVETTYAHLSAIAPDLLLGTAVKSGQVIGAVGQTGVATGPHLYYEIAIDGERIDPLKMPPAVPVALTGHALTELKQQIRQFAQD